MASETVCYKRGINQQFSLPSFKIDFTKWKPEEVRIINIEYVSFANSSVFLKLIFTNYPYKLCIVSCYAFKKQKNKNSLTIDILMQ